MDAGQAEHGVRPVAEEVPGAHNTTVRQTRSAVAEQGAASYSVAGSQARQAAHTRSAVGVQGEVS